MAVGIPPRQAPEGSPRGFLCFPVSRTWASSGWMWRDEWVGGCVCAFVILFKRRRAQCVCVCVNKNRTKITAPLYTKIKAGKRRLQNTFDILIGRRTIPTYPGPETKSTRPKQGPHPDFRFWTRLRLRKEIRAFSPLSGAGKG